MRIVFLLDRASPATHRTRTVLRDAADLAKRGHDVVVISDAQLRDGPVQTVDALRPELVPPADLVVATSAASVAVGSAVRGATVARYVTECRPEPGLPVPTVAVARTLVEWAAGRARGEIHVVPFGVDTGRFAPGPANARPHDPLRIGVRDSELAEAALVRAELTTLGLRAELVSLGDATPADALHEIDVLLAGSGHAADSLAPEVVEALACGVPCVLADLPALRASVDGRSDAAMFFDAGDPRAAAETIAFVARHDGLRQQLRRAAVEVAAGFGCERHVDELERAFALIAARANSRAAEPCPPTASEGPSATDVDLVHELARRADRHVRTGHHPEALACLEAALALMPDSPLTLTRLGEVLVAAGDLDRAVDAFDRAIASGGSSCRLHEARAEALRQLGGATRALHAASRCDDADAATFRRLADTLRDSGDLAAARIAVQEATVRAALG